MRKPGKASGRKTKFCRSFPTTVSVKLSELSFMCEIRDWVIVCGGFPSLDPHLPEERGGATLIGHQYTQSRGAVSASRANKCFLAAFKMGKTGENIQNLMCRETRRFLESYHCSPKQFEKDLNTTRGALN